jgi:hypothetical protein
VRNIKQLRPAAPYTLKAAIPSQLPSNPLLSTEQRKTPSLSPHLHTVNTANMMNFVISLLLQLSLFMLAEAAPITTESVKPWQAGTGGGIIGFIVLVLDIIAWSKFLHPS